LLQATLPERAAHASTIAWADFACATCLPSLRQIAELKAWVTDNSQEDDAFFAMSQSSKTKKADWVKYVTAKIAAAAAPQ
jgi:hypothetical protein